MVRQYVVLMTLWLCAFGEGLYAQVPGKVDFGRDVLPIFKQNCVACHGPSQQINGLRVDRRSSVFKSRRRVVPGSSENSFLYHRLSGTEFGLQMPPTGPLRPEQISVIKTWIDQGAEWPDALANEAESPPIDPKAIAMVEALRTGDRQRFMKFVAQDPKLLNARGPEGSTPFMYVVLYSDAATLKQLLGKGADPNRRNDAQATALMWAATDLAKTRVLLAHGADVNASSDDVRTPLLIAAGRPGGAPIVKLLLDHGANPNPTKSPAEFTPLSEAAAAGDAESMELLIAHGADVRAADDTTTRVTALALASGANCSKCVDLLFAKGLNPKTYTAALQDIAVLDDVNLVRRLVDHGADVNAVDPMGRTALMYAAVSDLLPLDVVKLLVERGASVNAKSQHKQSGDFGQTALDMAKLHGDTAIVDFLSKSGGTSAGRSALALERVHENSIQAAVQRSLPLLQRTDADFVPKAGCVSCHNNSLEAMAVGLARKNGFHVDEQIAAQQVKANVSALEQRRDALRQGFFVGAAHADPVIASYILVGLDAEHYKADLNTDAVAAFLETHQVPDGHWAFGPEARPPLCSDDVGQTVLAMRALQLYPPRVDQAAYERSIELAAAWLAKAPTRTNDDRSWRLLGLAWAGKNKGAIQKAMREVLAVQRSDGGWSDLASMDSAAYATGKALVALETAGLPVSDPTYQRGVQFLLNTQLEDGSWYVRTRAAGFQPYFENGFPHGVDQWISAASTSWATMALALASQASAATSTSVARLR